MEASIRDFVTWRLREIDVFLTGLYGHRKRWQLIFQKECRVHHHEMAQAFTRLFERKPGRVPKLRDSVNLRIATVLEKWASEKHGFVSQYVVTKPSRFTTRRASLRTGEPDAPKNLPPADPTFRPKPKYRRNARPSVPHSLAERDEELFEALIAGTSGMSLQTGDNELCTTVIMSNPEPSERQSEGFSDNPAPALPEPSPAPPPPDPAPAVSIDPGAFGAALDSILQADPPTPDPAPPPPFHYPDPKTDPNCYVETDDSLFRSW